MEDGKLFVQEEAIAWKERWARVNEFQLQEWMSRSPEQRLRELYSLYDFAKKLGIPGPDPTQPRERWIKLKKDFPVA